MKRSPELTPLSHDHQHGLAVALELTRVTAKTAPAAARAFRAFFDDEGRRHFRQEEELLLPVLARHVAADDPALVRLLTEHVEIRRAAQEIDAGRIDVEFLHALGTRLRDHIRHEERVVFPLAEERLSTAEIAELGASLSP